MERNITSGYATLILDGERRTDTEIAWVSPKNFAVSDSTQNIGKYDFVFLTVSVESLLDVASQLPALLKSSSTILSCTNGIPPWYSYGQTQTIGRFSFPTSPRETFFGYVPPTQLIGVIVERGSEVKSPGVLGHSSGKGFTIGELDHSDSPRAKGVCRLFEHTNLTVSLSRDIHQDIWLKLIGNVAVSPLSVLHESTIGDLLSSPHIETRMNTLIDETIQVGTRLGVLTASAFDRPHFFQFMREKLGSHRPSMLQNFLRGKPLEIHRILGVVQLLAEADGPVPKVSVPEVASLARELQAKVNSRRALPLSP